MPKPRRARQLVLSCKDLLKGLASFFVRWYPRDFA